MKGYITLIVIAIVCLIVGNATKPAYDFPPNPGQAFVIGVAVVSFIGLSAWGIIELARRA